MAKYVFFNFPTYGQMNPTLAIVQELVARGEEVVYFQAETFRAAIEATGAKFQPFAAPIFAQPRSSDTSSDEDNRRLALLPIRMIETSRQVVPQMLDRVQAEHPDCLIYSGLFLWARITAHALNIPGVALWPTYAPNAQFSRSAREGRATAFSPEARKLLHDAFISLRDTYHLPFSDVASLIRGEEGLVLVFLPRAFQPGGDIYDGHYRFVGPSFQPDRDAGHALSLDQLGAPPRLYISLGTIYNNQAEFYNACFRAFGDTAWHVILALGNHLDPALLQTIPKNFTIAPHVPQLAVLSQTDIFISHGGMNSTMESLYFGVPLIVIPHTNEQKMTAQRVQELGLGIALDETTVTAEALREAVWRISHDSGYKERVQAMQRHVREAGGFQQATDALQSYVHAVGAAD